MPFERITQAQIRSIVEDEVGWEYGIGFEWECDAIISADLLEKLCRLAALAPFSEKRKAFPRA